MFKLYVIEPGSRESWAILTSLHGGLIVSWLSDVEMATSFHRTQTPFKARKAYSDYLADRSAGLFLVSALDSAIYIHAATLAEEHANRFKLRSLDAIHLAVALANNASAIATYDDRLAQAAKAMGLQVIPA